MTYDNSSIGEVKIFEKDSGGNWPSTASATYTGPSISASTWTQLGSDIDGEAPDDWSGSVSMSADGTRVAIGAERNDGTGTDAGHVRVYAESGGTWTQVGADIDGEAAADWSGDSVSMSSDGTRVAIGAHITTVPATWLGMCACTPRAAGRGPRWVRTSTARLR